MLRKRWGLFVILAFGALLIAGCDNKTKEKDRTSEDHSSYNEAPAKSTDKTQENNVNSDGSTSVESTEATEATETTEETETTEASETSETTKNTEITDTTETVETVPEQEQPEPATNFVTDEMYTNAMLNEGNLARLAAAMKKAKNGQDITVGVIGGSITQGSSASTTENSYAAHFRNWWEKAFPDTKINYVNAGIGATTSYLGVHRVDKDLLSYQPDVVIVEFSVNDSNTLFFKETYEDLVRRILQQENMPAVIQLFMTMEDGTSAQMQHLLVGFTYNLPRISYGQAVLKEIAKGTFTWDDISPDNIHPNDKGHAIAGEILWKYLNSVYAKLDTITEEPSPLDVTPIFTERYIDGNILDSSNLEPVTFGSFENTSIFDRYPNNWGTTEGKEAIVFEVEAQNIGIMYYKTVSGSGGQFDVYIDGEYAYQLDADFSGGWGSYAESVEVFRSKEKKLHKIEIRKAEDSTGDQFTILGLLIS